MGLFIRDDSVRDMARRLADARRITVTEAVRQALERELTELQRDRAQRERLIRESLARRDALPERKFDRDDMDDEIGASRWTGTVRIVVDTSALLAILLQGPERERFLAALLDNDPIISIATDRDYLVLFGRRGAAALDELDRQIAGYRSKSCRLRWMINTVCGKRCSISAKAADGRRRC